MWAKAARLIDEFISGVDFDAFCDTALVRSAVERQFEVIGEALSQLARLDPSLASRVPEHRRIVAFRNVLIHGYAAVDQAVVWQIIHQDLPVLRASVRQLLSSLDPPA